MNNTLTESSPTQIITLMGVILSFIVGVVGLWIGIRNSRKTIFINSVTASRIKYIYDLKSSIAEFCILANNYFLLERDIEKTSPAEKLYEIRREFKCKYLIQLNLNPEDTEWDKRIISLLEEIVAQGGTTDPQKKINELITITQYLLKLEWEGAKLESQRGILSKKEKNKLYRKYLRLYEEHIKNGDNGQ